MLHDIINEQAHYLDVRDDIYEKTYYSHVLTINLSYMVPTY